MKIILGTVLNTLTGYMDSHFEALERHLLPAPKKTKEKRVKQNKKQCEKWSLLEEEKLLKEFKEQKIEFQMTMRHERSLMAIDKRQCLLVKKFYDEHESIEEIAEITNLSCDEVKIRIKKPL